MPNMPKPEDGHREKFKPKECDLGAGFSELGKHFSDLQI